MRFTSKLLKQAYGYDQSGDVLDQEQKNIQDTTDANNPDKKDYNHLNNGLDTTLTKEEQQEMAMAKDFLNPPNA